MNRPMIGWLASYPKSGNTWVRVLLANCIRNGEKPVHINDLGNEMHGAVRSSFDRWFGMRSSDLTLDEVESYRPESYRYINGQARELKLLKVHDAYSNTIDGEPLFPMEVTRKAIYIVRNPLDVAVSYASHLSCSLEQVVKRMGDPLEMTARNHNSIFTQFPQKLHGWSGHASSWLNSDLPLQLVRYEDLLANTEHTLANIVYELGLAPNQAIDQRIRRAVSFSDFKLLQQQELTDGFREKRSKQSIFFRQGQAGSWRDSLSAELAARVITDHGPLMQRFGYL